MGTGALQCMACMPQGASAQADSHHIGWLTSQGRGTLAVRGVDFEKTKMGGRRDGFPETKAEGRMLHPPIQQGLGCGQKKHEG